ncbi:hypothetical protein LUD75_14755 [Epilithonimonas sp. JDS]|uniref:hypothetical protein n=1 Tax=Epilithonimonas sp. JDS TaxID=2902797 RepID=UPI001E57CDFA|nr:hypothetical protein [Epilithonimonas sp. JDS]MCD9855984.1 hypothetical protein [Epilithonimonas sp. JDS]
MKNVSKTFTNFFAFAVLILFSLSVLSCAEPAERFFGTAILNTNAIGDFATPTLAKHINDETTEFPDIPSSKKKGDEAGKLVQNNILYMEKSLSDIKALNANSEDRKAIKEKSIALYEFVIPVYKNEYTNYAKLCDTKADQARKDELAYSIEQKYGAKFEKMYTELMEIGKVFAAENKLDVNWN